MSKRFAMLLLLTVSAVPCLAQKAQRVRFCSQTTFDALKTLPYPSYDCPQELDESDEKTLTLPARVEALRKAVRELEAFRDPAWWQADIEDLQACELHGRVGPVSAADKEKYRDGAYRFGVFGSNSIRLVLLPDPCYQIGYDGSVVFLLARTGGKVYVTKIFDGYYSRIDNSVSINFARLNGQEIIEISTDNNMTPSINNYYYVIDPKSHKAVPKKLFKVGKKLTNEIRSAVILGEPSELGLPRDASDMQIIKEHRLLPTFSAYEEAYVDGGIGGKLKQTVYRWNGRFYARR